MSTASAASAAPKPSSTLPKPQGTTKRHRASVAQRRFAFGYDPTSAASTQKFLVSNIPKPAIDRMKLLAGAHQIRSDARMEVRAMYYGFVRALANAAVIQMQNEGLNTLMLRHLTRAAKQSFGHTYYPGYIMSQVDL